jgi:hypothetical protein
VELAPPDKAEAGDGHWWRWLLGGLACLVLAVLLLPWWLPVDWVTRRLEDRLAAQGLGLRVGAIEIGWFRPTAFREIAFLDPEQQPLVTVRAVHTEHGLLRQLLSGRRLGQIEIDGLRLDLTVLESGTNLQRTLEALGGDQPPSPTESPASNKSPPRIDFDLLVRDLELLVWREGSQRPLFDSGTTALHARYRAADGDAVFSLDPATVLENVELSPELLRLGLGLIVPPVADSTSLAGNLSLTLDRLELPLAAPQTGHVQGELAIHRFEAAAAQPLAKAISEPIARWLQRSDSGKLQLVADSRISFELADQRMYHEGLAFGLPELDPRLIFESRGSVGADRSLDMEVLVPVPLELLARRDSVRELGIPQLTVPVRGTLDAPQVDFSAVISDVGSMLGNIGTQLESSGEAPGLSAVFRAIDQASNQGDPQAITASLGDVFKAVRERRQQRFAEQAAAAEEAQSRTPVSPASDRSEIDRETEDPDAPPARPGLLRRWRERRRP